MAPPSTKTLAVAAARRLLRPIARILIRCGVSWKEFAQLAKLAYVEVARQDYGIQGRPTNASRVALLTGLSRREVGEIRRQLTAEPGEQPSAGSRISSILSGWHQDPDYLDDAGRPRELPAAGAAPSLASLLKRYAGDIPKVAVTKELLNLGLVERRPGGAYRVLSRHYTRGKLDPDRLRQAGVALHDHAHTLAHNVNSERSEGALFEGIASSSRMPGDAAERLNGLLQKEGQQFLERFDAWLAENELSPAGDRDKGVSPHRTGVGIYLFDYPLDSEDEA